MSVTCTSAGCLLAGAMHPAEGIKACCAAHHSNSARNQPRHDDRGPCPTCQSPVLIKSVEQNTHHVAMALLPVFLSWVAPAGGDDLAGQIHLNLQTACQTTAALTLLALHCALLN